MDSLDWASPRGTEVALAGGFVAREGPSISVAFSGSSKLDTDLVEFIPSRPVVPFEEAMRAYIKETLRINFESWDDDLAEKLRALEEGYRSSKKGFWHSFWLKMGDQRAAEVWTSFIPESHGLSVLKGGLSLIFLLANNSVEKRQKILDTFTALQDALIQASPDRATFRSDYRVRDAADKLYEALVASMDELFVLLTTKKRSTLTKFGSHLKRGSAVQKPVPTIDEVLQKVQDATKAFSKDVDLARDQTIERTEIIGLYTINKTHLIHQDIMHTRDNTERLRSEGSRISTHMERLSSDMSQMALESGSLTQKIDGEADHAQRRESKQDEQHREVCKLIRAEQRKRFDTITRMREDQEEEKRHNRTLLTRFLLEQKRSQAEIARLRRQVSQQSNRAVVSLDRLFEILASPRVQNSWNTDQVDLKRLFAHPNQDLDHALSEEGRFPPADRRQVDSLLEYDRFLDWADPRWPDLVLVEANINSAALESLSVISNFSATFVTSLVEVQPSDVVAHFFCGLHAHPGDFLHGPGGLVRSLATQLLMSLFHMDRCQLDFVDNREYLRQLEGHNLHSMCSMLHSLLRQFPADTRVYFIIDSISSFDADRMIHDLVIVMSCLQDILEDTRLPAILKVLVTTPALSTRRVKDQLVLEDDEEYQLITLN